MRTAILFALLSLFFFYVPLQINDNLRLIFMMVAVIISFSNYIVYKMHSWQKSGKNPAKTITNKMIGSLLGSISGFIGGVLSGCLVALNMHGDIYLAGVEGLFGALYGLLLGAFVGLSTDTGTHSFAGAVIGGCAGIMGGAMGALSPGFSTINLVYSSFIGGASGAVVGIKLGRNIAWVNAIISHIFPWLDN